MIDKGHNIEPAGSKGCVGMVYNAIVEEQSRQVTRRRTNNDAPMILATDGTGGAPS